MSLRSASASAVAAAVVTAAVVAPLAASGVARADTPQPVGDAGGWNLQFDDEFDGTSLDTSKWGIATWTGGNVNFSPANVSEADGTLRLELSQAGSGNQLGVGAQVSSSPAGAPDGYDLPVGGFVEARIKFPGNGVSGVYNWPAFWVSSEGYTWPANGEADVFEGLGTATANYHYDTSETPSSSSRALLSGPIPGTWTNAYHVYGMLRGATEDTVYYDGKVVWSCATHDLGGPEQILLTAGSGSGPIDIGKPRTALGAASQIRVGYVRAWTR